MNNVANVDLISKINPSIWGNLSSWQFISCCLCLAIVILTFKRAFKQFWPTIYANSTVHGAFTLSYLVGGLIAAIPKTYLIGTTYFNRAILGILASGASLAVYHAAYKRLAKTIGMPDNYANLDDDVKEPTKPEIKPEVVDNGAK